MKKIFYITILLFGAQNVCASQYIYKSYEVHKHTEGVAGFDLKEVAIDTGNKMIYSNGIGIEYRIDTFSENIECLISAVWNLCLPQDFDGTQKEWRYGRIRFINEGAMVAGYIDNTAYFVISAAIDDKSKSSNEYFKFFYSIRTGLMGYLDGNYKNPKIYWLTAHHNGIKL